MALLSCLEVLGMYLYCKDISHARAIAQASADLFEQYLLEISEVSRHAE